MDLKERIWLALEEVIDPEIHVNIVDLGLVYGLEVDENKNVSIRMTLTIPECPMADEIVQDVKSKVEALPEVNEAKVELVWEPAWTPALMTDQGIEEFRRQRSGL
ncbi:hypothetical protein J31TS4_04390 [Paenibacillus sp. J31TS4]|uniref:metal-sulfur cluster assembly factor n=1 Tax=Paenibacillus sp. J31TS4 TaxID=2807195 RepID=UPI001B0A43EC|nr:metal-sulfur cluster assembly factor [Paenibacillus sp. J31TS4]GIP37159.1 hypothetical protein J31TS4_04390 [Paenibacillus sp. J31TS4]